MLAYFLYGLFFISCIVLVATVLLQPGKTDAGAPFTSNISSTAFGPRGTQSVLSKITITAATIFMLSALLLSLPALTGNVSVLQTTSGTAETKSAETNTNTANANVANSNTATNVISNSVNATVANATNSNSASNTETKANTNK